MHCQHGRLLEPPPPVICVHAPRPLRWGRFCAPPRPPAEVLTLVPQGNFRYLETHNPVSREELMMVLAGLEQLQIRALFSQTSSTVSLSRVVLEVASEAGGGPPASNVELCMCPANYRGDSCQVKG